MGLFFAGAQVRVHRHVAGVLETTLIRRAGRVQHLGAYALRILYDHWGIDLGSLVGATLPLPEGT